MEPETQEAVEVSVPAEVVEAPAEVVEALAEPTVEEVTTE